MDNGEINRRLFLKTGLAASAAVASSVRFPAISYASSRPEMTHGVQSGDISRNGAVIWGRADRPSMMHLSVSTSESFANEIKLPPSYSLANHDYAVKRLITGMKPDQRVFYRIKFTDLSNDKAVSEPVVGSFVTSPDSKRSLRFGWSGDTAGQGWGIDASRGGMTTYSAMLEQQPEFFIHCGDTVYADGPIAATKEMPDGGIWNNLVAEGVEKVAESLDEFRGRWKYNLLDHNVRAFNQQTPVLYQWDDHEVVNNWSWAKDLEGDDRYTEKSVPLLVARATRAFHEMSPIKPALVEPGRVYRKLSYGPHLDVFFLDLRSYRGPNSEGVQSEMSDESRVLGKAQLDWLKRELLLSRATWKVISSDQPLGLIVWDNWKEQSGVEAVANGKPGKPSGRELEFAELLRFMKNLKIKNTLFLTADVHYTAAHRYSPENAVFDQFDPFWEFVSGPLHAGTFGPNALDSTFGPEVMFVKAPTEEQGANLPPSMGLQFYGLVDIDGATGELTVRLMDSSNTELYTKALAPDVA